MVRRCLLSLCSLAFIGIAWLWFHTSDAALAWHGILPGGQDWAHVCFRQGVFECFVITREATSQGQTLDSLTGEMDWLLVTGAYNHTGPLLPVEPGMYYISHRGDSWTLDLDEFPKMFIVQLPIWSFLVGFITFPAVIVLRGLNRSCFRPAGMGKHQRCMPPHGRQRPPREHCGHHRSLAGD